MLEDPSGGKRQAKVSFNPDLMSSPEQQFKMCLSYLCNEMGVDPYETFKMQILSELLFEGPNAVFYKKLIEEGHAPAFCPGYGYDYTTR